MQLDILQLVPNSQRFEMIEFIIIQSEEFHVILSFDRIIDEDKIDRNQFQFDKLIDLIK